MIWRKAPSSRYLVKQGHLSISRNIISDNSIFYFFCWHNSVLPKAGSFLWLALHNKILSSTRLERLGIFLSFSCVLYGKFIEDTKHLLVKCEFSNELGCWALQKLGWQGPLHNQLHLFLFQWSLLHKDSFFPCIWRFIPTIISWCLWWERNKRIFRKEICTLHQVIQCVACSISEMVNS